MAGVNEWLEVQGSSVDVAVEAALAELGLTSREQVIVEVLQEPARGILGTGWRAQDAVVKVTPKPPSKKRRRRRSRGGRGSRGGDGAPTGERSKSGERGGAKDREARPGRGKSNDGKGASDQASRRGAQVRKSAADSGKAKRDKGKGRPERRPIEEQAMTEAANPEDRAQAADPDVTIEERAAVAAEFVEGLLDAFGLEGEVTTTVDVDENILRLDVTGDQTEALVGRKGVIMQSVLDVARTVVQRKTFGAPRMRIDINGYGERRREALRIYATRQADRVLGDGGEIMLEPMNAADRKVVHDAVAEIDGVQSYSEGEDPDRAVVIAPVA